MGTALKTQQLSIIFLICFTSLHSGCGLIFGGDQRVDNKSHDYTVVRLDRDSSDEWRRLSQAPDTKEHAVPQEMGDVAYESKKTGSIISLNSVCQEYRDATLEELTRYLLLGINTHGPVKSQDIRVDDTKALESTVNANMAVKNNAGATTETIPVRVRAVVLSKGGCTYDFMLIARPNDFPKMTPTFERFLKGFHTP